MKRSCVVSLIGRPNVGKSTIFNRLMRKSFKAISYDLPGVTRDRHYGIAQLENASGEDIRDLIVVDTGGFYPEKVEEPQKLGKRKTAEPFFNIMADQAKLAIDESDLVLMVVDIREGLIPFDKTICDYIRSTQRPFWLLVNKYDDEKLLGQEAEFYSLGIDEEQLFMVSAEHGRGLQTLKENLYSFIKQFENTEQKYLQRGVKPNYDVVANVAIVGAPNAGKSTLLNQFIGAQRALVSNVAGTTVDPIEGYCDLYFGSDVENLSAQTDQFRKSNTELLEEYKEFEEEFSEGELAAYNELPDELKYSDDDYDSYDHQEEDEEISFDEVDESENDIFTLSDIESKLDAASDDSEDESEITDEDNAQEDADFNPFRSIKLVDTAGIRKQKSVSGFIEEQSVYRSLKAISEADVIIYMIDVTKGITHQDRRLCDIALERGKSLVICLNKIDLVQDVMQDKVKKREWMLDLRASVPWLAFCELITISAQKGSHLKALKTSLRKTIMIRNSKVTTGKLNKTVTALMDRNPIVVDKAKGLRLRVKYASMLKSSPPTFLLFTNRSQGVPPNYRRYLTNALRKEFNLVNTPVHLIFRTTTDIERRLKKV